MQFVRCSHVITTSFTLQKLSKADFQNLHYNLKYDCGFIQPRRLFVFASIIVWVHLHSIKILMKNELRKKILTILREQYGTTPCK